MLSINEREQLRRKLEATAAYVDSLKGGIETSIELLKTRKDPESIKRHLSILINAKRFTDGVEVVAGLNPDLVWSDQAVTVHVAAGNFGKAKELIEWAKNEHDLTVWERSILNYVLFRYSDVLARFQLNGGVVRAELLSETERAGLSDALQVAQPIVNLVVAKGIIENELESEVIQRVLHAESLLGPRKDFATLATTLLLRKPVPILVAKLMLLRTVPFDKQIVQRLRTEHPSYIEAQILAGFIEGTLQQKPSEALDSLLPLADSKLDVSERVEYCKVLFELAQLQGAARLKQIEGFATNLLGAEHPLISNIRATNLLAEKQVDEAMLLLEASPNSDDPHWLQVYAACLLEKGETGKAIEHLEKAASILPHPQILSTIATLAFGTENFVQATKALERLQKMFPESGEIASNLSLAYVKLERWKEAADQFLELARIDPKNQWHLINAAKALANFGDIEGSLRLYNKTCEEPNGELAAHIARAEILKTLGRPIDAFNALKEIKSQYWDSPLFVSSFLEAAFGSENEDEGHLALMQLKQLQELGKVGAEILQEKSFDDIRNYQRQFADRLRAFSVNVLQGKLPWLFGVGFLGSPSFAAWKSHTQDLPWLNEDPTNWAQYVVYATNGFATRGEGSQAQLREITCPKSETHVVIDLSALYSLYQLKLLPTAVEYFGRIYYPSSYMTLRLKEGSRLAIHQPSRWRAMVNLREAVDSRRIKVVNGSELQQLGIPLVKEHTLPEDTTPYYRIQDIADAMRRHGGINETELQRIYAIAHKAAYSSVTNQPLEYASRIAIDLRTLETICQAKVLGPVLLNFDVQITSQQYDELVAELSSFKHQIALSKEYEDLWNWVRNEPRMVQASYSLPAEWDPQIREEMPQESFAAMFLAMQQNAPLLADDRVCQNHVFMQRRLEEDVAFGTDQLLLQLGAEGRLTWDSVADSFLTLISWRYRFLTMNSSVVIAIARRYRHSLPGDQLKIVARYVHECMRDPGLFGGFEQTNPPVSMANRLYQMWVSIVAETIAAIWLDHDSFTSEQAEAFTKWSLLELLPSTPRIGGRGVHILSELTPVLIYSRLLLKLCATDNYERGKRCIQTVASALTIPPEQAQKIILEVIDAI